MDDLEKYSRRHTLRICGAKEEVSENVEGVIKARFTKLHITMFINSINVCHRLPAKEGEVKQLIDKFNDKQLKTYYVLSK